jgi:deoxyribodipyrimidine photolyase
MQQRASIQFGFIVQLKTQKTMILRACLLKKWLPELADIPVNLIHEPWKLNPIEQQFYNSENREDYPEPIVNIEETRRYCVEFS